MGNDEYANHWNGWKRHPGETERRAPGDLTGDGESEYEATMRRLGLEPKLA